MVLNHTTLEHVFEVRTACRVDLPDEGVDEPGDDDRIRAVDDDAIRDVLHVPGPRALAELDAAFQEEPADASPAGTIRTGCCVVAGAF